MVSGDTISKWEMFVWILSHVPSAIALSLFILKSSNLDQINAPSYPNHSCDSVRLLIAYKLKLVLVPWATSEWSKVLRSFFNIVCYVHYQGSYRSWKTWKVMEFYNFTFQAWKLMEFRWGSWKVMENRYAFYEWKAVIKIESLKVTVKSKDKI